MSIVSALTNCASLFKQSKSKSLITELEPPSDKSLFVAVKGAPETLRDMFASLPSYYDEVYQDFALRGSRVLAIGYKWIDSKSGAQLKQMPRDEAESSLTFAGFLVFTSAMKPDTLVAI